MVELLISVDEHHRNLYSIADRFVHYEKNKELLELFCSRFNNNNENDNLFIDVAANDEKNIVFNKLCE